MKCYIWRRVEKVVSHKFCSPPLLTAYVQWIWPNLPRGGGGGGRGCFCSYFLHFLVLFPEFFVPKTSPLPCWNSVAAPGVHTHYSLLAYNFAYPEFEPAILHLHIIADWVLLMVALHTPNSLVHPDIESPFGVFILLSHGPVFDPACAFFPIVTIVIVPEFFIKERILPVLFKKA